MEKLTQKQIGSKITNKTSFKNAQRIEKENERLHELYKITQTLENGVKMPGTYISMGVYNTFSFYGASK